MSSPSTCRFSETHEWHRADGQTVVIGITPFAVNELTDITYAQPKKSGTKVRRGDSIGEVESVKATSDVYSGVDGEIIETNTALENDPSLINTDPFGKGWLVKIRATDISQLNALMDASTYDQKHPS